MNGASKRKLTSIPPPHCIVESYDIGVEICFHELVEIDTPDTTVYLDAIGDALCNGLNHWYGEVDFNRDILARIGGKPIDERQFLGDWFDHNTGTLLRHSWVPEMGSGGQFCYAFLCPPFELQASTDDIQRIFDEVRTFILPPGMKTEILDWSDVRLGEACELFKSGLEWWGVFLFTLYCPELKRLIVIHAAATD